MGGPKKLPIGSKTKSKAKPRKRPSLGTVPALALAVPDWGDYGAVQIVPAQNGGYRVTAVIETRDTDGRPRNVGRAAQMAGPNQMDPGDRGQQVGFDLAEWPSSPDIIVEKGNATLVEKLTALYGLRAK